MELDIKLKLILLKINFCERYNLISKENQYLNNESVIDNDYVLNMIKVFGYNPKFNKSETFYKIIEKKNNFIFQFNISLRYGNVELIWDLLHNNERINLGSWGVVYKHILNRDERPLMPKFRNIDDLNQIFKEVFSIYEDFKIEFLLNF